MRGSGTIPEEPRGVQDATSVIACFDLDGVLVDSEALKVTAFRRAVEQVLKPDAEAADAIDAYNRRIRGVPRREKFTVATTLVLGGADETDVQALLDAYASLLADSLLRTHPMPGAVEFAHTWPGRRALVTSAPRIEAESQLRRLGFPRFHYMFDADTPKTDALRHLAHNGEVPVIFFGDAQADADAAAGATVAFVAVGTGIEDLSRVTTIARVENLAAVVGREQELARTTLQHMGAGGAADSNGVPSAAQSL